MTSKGSTRPRRRTSKSKSPAAVSSETRDQVTFEPGSKRQTVHSTSKQKDTDQHRSLLVRRQVNHNNVTVQDLPPRQSRRTQEPISATNRTKRKSIKDSRPSRQQNESSEECSSPEIRPSKRLSRIQTQVIGKNVTNQEFPPTRSRRAQDPIPSTSATKRKSVKDSRPSRQRNESSEEFSSPEIRPSKRLKGSEVAKESIKQIRHPTTHLKEQVSAGDARSEYCGNCINNVQANNVLKSKLSQMEEIQGSLRKSCNILSEDNDRLRKKIALLEKTKEELRNANQRSSKRRLSIPGSGRNNRKAASAWNMEKLPDSEKCIYTRSQNMLLNRLQDDVTESTLDSDGKRVRDWALSDEPSRRIMRILGPEDKNGRAVIKLNEGSGAVPICPMAQAKMGKFYTSRYADEKSLVRAIVHDAIDEDDTPLISEEDREERADVLVGLLMSEFLYEKRKMLSDRKKRAKCRFFNSLGYLALGNISPSASELAKRESEREVLSQKLLSVLENGQYDLSWWRTARFDDLKFNEDVSESSSFNGDKVFGNSAAIQALETLRGFSLVEGTFSQDATVLSIARADAWITATMIVMKEKRKKGGNTGSLYTSTYESLLPIATEQLLRHCHDVVQELHPNEISLSCSESMEESPELSNNLFQQSRKATKVFRMPTTKQLYLVVKASFFTKHITAAAGRVLDCYIGIARQKDLKFRAIAAKESSEEVDTSDEDIQEVGISEEEAVGLSSDSTDTENVEME